MYKYLVAALALGIALSVASVTRTADEETVRVGLAVGLTGYAANWGEGEVAAVKLAYEAYKDQLPPIEFVIEDTQSDGLGTVNAVTKLIDVHQVPVIIGPTWGDSFQGGYPLAEKSKVVVLAPSAALEAVANKSDFAFLFSTWWPQRSEAGAVIMHMRKSGSKKLCALNDQDSFNSLFATFIADAWGEGVHASEVPIGTTDFRTEVAKIIRASCDVVFAGFQDTSAIGPFMKQLKEQGSAVRVYSSTSAQNQGNLEKFPGMFDGLLYSYPAYDNDLRYQTLIEGLSEEDLRVATGPSFVNAYNAALLLFEALKIGARTGEEIKDALRTVHVAGIGMEDLYLNSEGQIGNASFRIKTVQDNQFVNAE
jgi:ABC-type branched-subunit amino acid transport system substrate-binding protein